MSLAFLGDKHTDSLKLFTVMLQLLPKQSQESRAKIQEWFLVSLMKCVFRPQTVVEFSGRKDVDEQGSIRKLHLH